MRERLSDGDLIQRDSRGEDPLVYYLPGGDWNRAIGWEIEPLYEDHLATAVTSRVWPDHETRLAALDPAALLECISRTVAVLSRWNPGWTKWEARWPSFVLERVGPLPLGDAFHRAGWTLTEDVPGGSAWQRQHEPRPL